MSCESESVSMEVLQFRQTIGRLAKLESSEGKTSFISFYVPAKMTQINLAKTQLTRELGSASCIKDRNTGKAVREGLLSLVQRLKDGPIPRHGFCLFVGHNEAGKLFVESVEALAPIEARVYVCDARFALEPLQRQLDNHTCENTRGFLIVDGNGAIFASMKGKKLTVHSRFDVDLPNKHRRGGQSAPRFNRCRS